jgi:hypothetical protein
VRSYSYICVCNYDSFDSFFYLRKDEFVEDKCVGDWKVMFSDKQSFPRYSGHHCEV